MRKIRLHILPLVFSLLINSPVGARHTQTAPGQPETQQRKHIQVIIIGIPEFSINAYSRSTVLRDEIIQRCKDVTAFFRDTFKNQVDFHIRCKKATTTRNSLRTLLQGDLPTFAANNLTIVFIMTHGEVDTSRHNNFVSPDLTLVTSDSVNSDEKNWRLSTISVGADLMPWLEDVPEGSTILTFLDTCHAGAAANLSTQMQGDFAQLFGLRMLVVASSLAQEKAYKASFTKALLEQWKTSKVCLTDAGFAKDIEERIKKDVGNLSQFEGVPQKVVRFNGDLCLPFDRLQAGKTRLLLIYSGASRVATSFSVRNTNTDAEVASGSLVDSPVQLVRLLPGTYRVVVSETGIQPMSKLVDLTTDEPGMVFIHDLEHPQAVEALAIAAADGAAAIGLPSAKVADLRKRAVAISVANHDATTAATVKTDLRRSGDEDVHLETLRGLAFKDMAEIQTYLAQTGASQEDVGRRLILTGDFDNAAKLLEQSLTNISDPQKRKALAELCYYTYGAAGNVAEAAKVRSQYGLSLDRAYVVGQGMPELEQQAQSSKEAADTFHSMATINMMMSMKRTEVSKNNDLSPSSSEWQQYILWSVRNSDVGGSIDCPQEYRLEASDCLTHGGRNCVMRKAINAAEAKNQTKALHFVLITQCHNRAAAAQLTELGSRTVAAYLTSAAAEFMGESLWMGFGGVEINYPDAKKYFDIAARHGNARAMANIGWMYENGFGVERSYQDAKDWYEIALGHGDIIAHSNMGRLYELGLGVKPDLTEAISWYKKGAAAGDVNSVAALQRLNAISK